VIRRPGLIRIGFDDLLSALRSQNGRCIFGFGESDSDNRAHEAIALALRNPLMDRGRMLVDAQHILVQISGGPGMTLSEVEIVMQELGRHVEDHTQILFGTAVDGKMGNRLSVTLISSISTEEPVQNPKSHPAPPVAVVPEFLPPPMAFVPPSPEPIEIPPVTEIAVAGSTEIAFSSTDFQPESLPDLEESEMEEAPPEPVYEAPPPPEPVRKIRKPAPVIEPVANAEKPVQARQEVMQFEPVTRGRFEKSEPTIVEGQDLDVPTYLRKNVRVK
jgi:cell division protein FtsZ